MALILKLEEKKAIVLTVAGSKIIDDLRLDDNIGKFDDNQEFIMLDTLRDILSKLECSILPEPNYESGGTKVTLGIPKEIIVTQRKNSNLPHLNSSSGL